MAKEMVEAPQTTCNVHELRRKLGCEWPAIERAKRVAQEKREQLDDLLVRGERKLVSEDTSFVAFGSLARNEWTSKSDLDWTFLVDGQGDPEHLPITQLIAKRLSEAGFGTPGPTGVFGNMAFSHDIIHQIGGQHDTNRNTTQRILLLLESTAIARSDAYDRVVAGILNRYLQEDTSFLTSYGKQTKIPRFLLNDIVRFWRTMAVDFASKQRERAGEGWALRNLKLRMSRKLIFVTGLLTCFSCLHNPSPDLRDLKLDAGQPITPLVNHLKRYVSLTPLQIVAESILLYDIPDATAAKLFTSYDSFLEAINDDSKRKQLQELRSDAAESSTIFNEMRECSHAFQDALTEMFFENRSLFSLIRTYGVF